MTFRSCIEVLACALLLAATAQAAPTDDAFKQRYEAGLNLYSSEEYEAAIREFQAAYALKPKPRLLFNIGQAHRNLGNAKEALRYYLLYQAMETSPKPGLKAELEGYIAQMKSIVAQAERARRAEDTPPPANPTPPPTPTTIVYVPPSLVAAPPAHKPVYKRGWFWGVLASSSSAARRPTSATPRSISRSRSRPSRRRAARHSLFCARQRPKRGQRRRRQ